MNLISSRNTIKSVIKPGFELILSEDNKGIYHVIVTDLDKGQIHHVTFNEMGMALYVFDHKYLTQYPEVM